MGEHAETHFLDVADFEMARSIHRVVRAMHDGECPRCHRIFPSASIALGCGDEQCPNCGFTITADEIAAAVQAFAPVMDKNLEVFERWRGGLLKKPPTTSA